MIQQLADKLEYEHGWPKIDYWRQVRADQRIAKHLCEQLLPLQFQPEIAAKLHYLEQLERTPIIVDEVYEQVHLIHETKEEIVVQVIVDRWAFDVPSVVRWTLQLREKKGGNFSTQVLQSQTTDFFSRQLRQLSWNDACFVLRRLQDIVQVEELTRGEIGPIQLDAKRPSVAALLTRLSPSISRVFIDDPLADSIAGPAENSGFGMSHQRKWAVPRHLVGEHKAWLRTQHSKNIVYGY